MATTLITKGQFECCKRVLMESLTKFRNERSRTPVGESNLLYQWTLEHNIELCDKLRAFSSGLNVYQTHCFQKLLIEIQGLPPTDKTLLLQASVFFNWYWVNLKSGKLPECYSALWKWAVDILSGGITTLHLLIVQLVGSLCSRTLIWTEDVIGALTVITKVELLQNKCMEHFSRNEFIDECLSLTTEESDHDVKNIIVLDDIPKGAGVDPISYGKTFVLLTLATCHILGNNLNMASDVLEAFDSDIWKHFTFYIKAVLNYAKGSVLEAKKIARALLESKGKSLEGWLKARLCNIIGCSLSSENKPNLSLSWFFQASQEDVDFLLPLWNIAIQLYKTRKTEGVTETLLLLSELSSKQKASHGVSKIPCYGNIHYIEVLHFVAKWYMLQKDFGEACLWYEKILDKLKEGYTLVMNKGEEKTACRLLYVEASYAFLRNKDFQKCIETAEIGLRSAKPSELCSHPSKSNDEVRGMNPRPTSSKRIGNELTETQASISCPGETSLQEVTETNEVHCEKPLVQSLLQIRASAFYLIQDLVKCEADLNENRGAFFDLNQYLSSSPEREATEQSIENPEKRIRLEDGLPDDKSGNATGFLIRNNPSVEAYDLLKSQSYSNLAVISIQKGQWQDAVHLLRVSKIHYPGNWDAIYNYTLLLLKMNRFVQAKITWCNAWKKHLDRKNFSLEGIETHLDGFSVSKEEIKVLHEVFEI